VACQHQYPEDTRAKLKAAIETICELNHDLLRPQWAAPSSKHHD
jgi:hypothetical protein